MKGNSRGSLSLLPTALKNYRNDSAALKKRRTGSKQGFTVHWVASREASGGDALRIWHSSLEEQQREAAEMTFWFWATLASSEPLEKEVAAYTMQPSRSSPNLYMR